MTYIINVKHREDHEGKIAYCGLNYDYWLTIFPRIAGYEDLSCLGKPKHCIVRDDRVATLAKYRRWLWKNIHRNDIAYALERIGSGEFEAIACFCKPLKCHCEVILKAADWITKEK